MKNFFSHCNKYSRMKQSSHRMIERRDDDDNNPKKLNLERIGATGLEPATS